jgi:hypothetical protein
MPTPKSSPPLKGLKLRREQSDFTQADLASRRST